MKAYVPRGNIARLFAVRAREVLLEGPAGTGKTRGLLEKARYLCEKYPGTRILFVRKTMRSLRESVMVTWEEHVLGHGHPAIHGTATRQTRVGYRFPNGSYVALGGLDDPLKTYSQEYTAIYVFEAVEVSLDAWERLLRCLRWPWGPGYHQIVADTNPGSEYHWLNQRALAGKMVRLKTYHRDNPMMWDYTNDTYTEFGRRYVQEVLAGMSEHRRRQLLNGEWVGATGLVWEVYSPDVHLVDREEVPPMQWYGASMDFGFTNPGCLQVWGVDKEARTWRVAEVYRTGWSIERWADVACELWNKWRFVYGVADCAEPGSIKTLNDRVGPLLGRNAPALWKPADKSRGKQHGLQQVRSMLEPDKTGRPRLFLVRDALCYGRDDVLRMKGLPTCTEEEILGYSYEEPKEGQPPSEKPDKANPNHGCDAMEYWVTTAFRRLRPEAPQPERPREGTYGALFAEARRKRRMELRR